MNEFGNLTLRSIRHETLSSQIQGLLPHLQYQLPAVDSEYY